MVDLQSRATITAGIAENLPSNGIGGISAKRLRDALGQILDGVYVPTDDPLPDAITSALAAAGVLPRADTPTAVAGTSDATAMTPLKTAQQTDQRQIAIGGVIKTIAGHIADRTSDEVKLRALGFVGDGQSRPLSTVYPTLAAAQLVFPRATSLIEEIDGHAIQRVLDLNVQDGFLGKRAALTLPAGICMVSKTIDTGDYNTTIRGAGRTNTVLFFTGTGSDTSCLRHGVYGGAKGISNANSTRSSRTVEYRDFSVVNHAYVPGTVGVDINFQGPGPGYAQCLTLAGMVSSNFGTPFRIADPYRGMHVENCVAFSDNAYAAGGGFQFIANNDWGCSTLRWFDCLTLNYEMGWDIEVAAGGMESVSLDRCSSYNGTIHVNINCTQPGYQQLLTSIVGNDWQGDGPAFNLRNTRNVSIREGFYIYATQPPVQRVRPDGFGGTLPIGSEQTLVSIIGSDSVLLDFVELATSGGSNYTLVNTETGCSNIRLNHTIVTAYGTANAGFRLCGGAANTTVEMNTIWHGWGAGPKIAYAGSGGQAQQISMTDADANGGTVDEYGNYFFKGSTVVTTDSNSRATIAYPNFPRRANGQPFFTNFPFVVPHTGNSNGNTGQMSFVSSSPTGFVMSSASPGFAGQVNWMAAGK